MEPYWDQIKEIVRESDVVLEILDARAVDISRNEQLEKIIKEAGRPRIYVVNKSDLISKQEREKAIADLKTKRDVSEEFVLYFSNRNKKMARNLLNRIKQVFQKHGKRNRIEIKTGAEIKPMLARPYREAHGDIIVGVVGYPNVGKSSVINALSFKKKAKVSSKAGTTHGIHWITAGDEIKLIDTPGVIPIGTYVEEAKLGIISARSAEKLKEVDVVAGKIIEQFMKEGKLGIIEEFYGFKIKEENKDNAYLIIEQLALEKKHLKKGGLPDEKRAAILLVKSWQTGRLRL